MKGKVVISIFITTFLLFVVTGCGVTDRASKAIEGTPALYPLTSRSFHQLVFEKRGRKGEQNFVGERPVVIEFGAPWCYHCKKLSLLLREMTHHYSGRVDFYRVNCDKELELASEMKIKVLPTTLFINSKGEIKRVEGTISGKNLHSIIEGYLLNRENN